MSVHEGETYRHKKGGIYKILSGNAVIEKDWEGPRHVVYRGEHDVDVIRPLEEFEDGRFTLVTDSVAASKKEHSALLAYSKLKKRMREASPDSEVSVDVDIDDPEVYEQLSVLAKEAGTTVGDIAGSILEMAFEEYGVEGMRAIAKEIKSNSDRS
jgi:hypothetical protein